MPIAKKNPDTGILTRCISLARKECCNYWHGLCRETDEKCHLISAYPTIHDGALDCDWFLTSVLPQDRELNRLVRHELEKEETLYEDDDAPAAEEPTLRCCAICGKEFLPVTNNQKYCSECRKNGYRIGDRFRQRAHRARKR